MGITGLIPFAKPASSEQHIKSFKGQTAAIDSYCWLHKGAFGCADKLAMGEKTDGYVSYCFKYIDMLLTFKIKPIMVFDGQHLPAKLLTEKKRRESRNLARKRATECLKLGNMAEARSNFKRCVDITPEMAMELIKECRKRNIDCIVAPYEADAQLAYLNRTKLADFVISEDSDLLTFGCSKVLFKLDLNGRGTLIESDKLYLATKERPDNFSHDRFRYMCILSGCDYLESLPGIGLKKALKFLKCVSNDDIYNNIAKMPSILNMNQLVVTKEYREQFMIADATFRHQLVFDVFQKKLIPLTDPGKCGTNLEYCCNSGKMLDSKIAYQIAIGNLNPFTHEELSNWKPQQSNFGSIWCRSTYAIQKPISVSITAKKEKINRDFNIQINSLPQQEFDNKLEEKLIKLYSVESIEEPPAKKICIREEIEKESPKKNLTSPVLSGRKQLVNPFLKKSRTNLLNKFSATEEKTVVVSKYFCDDENDPTVKTDSSEADIKTDSSETDIKTEFVDSQEETLSSSQSSNKENSDNNEEVELNSANTSSENIKISENKVLKIETTSQSQKTVQFSRVKVQTFMKCRPQGLLKSNQRNADNKFKPNKNQPTLFNMFGFTKK